MAATGVAVAVPARCAVMNPRTSAVVTCPGGVGTTVKNTCRSNPAASTEFGRHRASRNMTCGTRSCAPGCAGTRRTTRVCRALVSCVFCVLSGRRELVLAAQLNPALAADYAAVEARIGHTFRVELSMADIIAQAAVAS